MKLSGLLLVAILGAILLSSYGGVPEAGVVASGLMVLFFVLEFRDMRKTARIFIAAGAAMTGFALIADDPVTLILSGLESGAFLTAFIASLAGMRAMADKSELVRRCGKQLMSQPPGRRYLALAFGGSVFGAIINIGSLNLLGSMLRQAVPFDADGEQGEKARLALRRGLIAVLRGFSTSLLWSPLSISVALLLKTQPRLSWPELIGTGMFFALGSILFGWIFDRLFERDGRASTSIASSDDGWSIHWFPVVLILSVFSIAALLEGYTGVPMIVAVMTAVPIVTIIWMVVQERKPGLAETTSGSGRRAGHILREILPGYRNEMVIVSTAAYAGAIISHFLTPDRVMAAMDLLSLPAMAFPALVIWFVILAGLAGINPIVTVTIVATAFPDPEAFGVPVLVLAIASIFTWGLTVANSPVAMSTLIMGGFANVSGATVGLKWNGRFTLAAGIASSLVFAAWIAFAG